MSNIPPVWWCRGAYVIVWGGTSAASGMGLPVFSASKGYYEWQPLHEGSGEEAIPIDGEDFWTTKFLQTVPSAPPAKRWWPAEGEEDQRHGLAEKLPDLNTIENLWAIMKASLKRALNITSLPLLERSIKFISLMKKLAHPMPRRFQMYPANQGKMSKYQSERFLKFNICTQFYITWVKSWKVWPIYDPQEVVNIAVVFTKIHKVLLSS